MSFLLKYSKLYFTILPAPLIYSSIIGVDIGINASRRIPDTNTYEQYATTIGYSGLGIITGITYPISYPLFGCYVLYKTSGLF